MKFLSRRTQENPVHHHTTVAEEPTPTAEQQEQKKSFGEVEPLSEDFLRYLQKWGASGGKYIRLGDTIFVSSGPRRGFAGGGIQHSEILEQAMENPDVKERMLGAKALHGATEETIGPDGMTDAGKFDIYFLPKNEPLEDGTQGRFRVFGASASYGMPEQKGRDKTVQIAAEALGQHIRVENARHMDFS